ncbi:MAG: T9SS type A sorting domain-containing protein [Bacteroidales bacterium]|nr:T9SS type A sorting domain-containing protein [Bacteroidales bacterium]
MRKTALLIFNLLSTFFLFSQTPGTLDLTFGNNGTLSVDIGGNNNFCYSSAMQADQKIVLAGQSYNVTDDISFARLNPDGSLDAGFGSGGVVSFVFSSSDEQINNIKIQSDQKILGIGNTYSGVTNSMIMVRLTIDGQLDPSFSSDGMLVIDFGPGYDGFGMDLTLRDDGKILGLGYVRDLSDNVHCSLCRINANGSMDNSFGNNGTLIMNLLSQDNYTNNIALQGENIIVGGRSYDGDDHFLTLARFTPDGMLDNTFGINGISSVELVMDPWIIGPIGDMYMDAQDRILYGTYFEGLQGPDFAVYRFQENGYPDNTFGEYGLSVTSLMSGDGYINAICAQTDGKIIAAGTEDDQFTLVRYLEDGTPDAGFGTSGIGIVNTDFGYGIYSLNMQDDGLILAAGLVYNSTSDFAVARYYSGLNVGTPEVTGKSESLQAFPNPVENTIYFNYQISGIRYQISVYDLCGRKKYESILPKGQEQFQLDVSAFPVGVYIAILEDENGIVVRGKFVKR